MWRGRGRGGFPTIEDFDFAQEIRISHDGRPFLLYESRAWILDEQSRPVRPAGREVGWWRPVMDGERVTDELEALMSVPTGVMELHIGKRKGTQIEFATDAVVRTATAKEVTAGPASSASSRAPCSTRRRWPLSAMPSARTSPPASSASAG